MDELTLRDVEDLFGYWGRYPPVAERLLAVAKAGLGVEEHLPSAGASGPAPAPPSQQEIAAALAQMPWGRS